MLRRVFLVLATTMFLLPSVVFAGGSNNACVTQYPIILSHGMGTQAKVMRLIDYWGSIPDELRDNGAQVYITNVNAMDTKANKALAWKTQVLEILAVTGKKKVNVIGHSDGCLYTRYAISNLDMASKVASHTSIAGPHRGSVIADMIMGFIPNSMEPMVGDMLDTIWSFLMGDVNGNSVAQGYELTRDYMINTFNPNTPNISSTYYQSYAFKVKNLLGSGPIFGITWAAMRPIEGDNDVLVSVSSAKWGEFKGVIEGGSLGGGVNHLACVGLLSGLLYPPAIGFNAGDFFVGVVSDLKKKGL